MIRRRSFWTALLVALSLLPSSARAQDSPATMFGGDAILPTAGNLSVWRPRSGGLVPFVIFLEDARWEGVRDCWVSSLFRDLNDAGIAVIPIGLYGRDLRNQVDELDRYLRLIRRHAGWHRLDTSRFAVAGCGSGGHFAALLGTDPAPLEQSGLGFTSLRAVVTLRSAGIDLDLYVAGLRNQSDRASRRRLRWFGQDTALLSHVSPTSHLASPNAPSFFSLSRTKVSRLL